MGRLRWMFALPISFLFPFSVSRITDEIKKMVSPRLENDCLLQQPDRSYRQRGG